MDTSMKHAIVVDGLPVVETAKRDKLLNVVRKFFSQVGTIIDNGLEMPSDASGKSMGCARSNPAQIVHRTPEAHALSRCVCACGGAALPSSSSRPTRRRRRRSRRPTGTSSTRRTLSSSTHLRTTPSTWLCPTRSRSSSLLHTSRRSRCFTGSRTRVRATSTWCATTTRPRSGGTTPPSQTTSRRTRATTGPTRTCHGRHAARTSRPSTASASCCGAARAGRSCSRSTTAA